MSEFALTVLHSMSDLQFPTSHKPVIFSTCMYTYIVQYCITSTVLYYAYTVINILPTVITNAFNKLHTHPRTFQANSTWEQLSPTVHIQVAYSTAVLLTPKVVHTHHLMNEQYIVHCQYCECRAYYKHCAILWICTALPLPSALMIKM